MRNFQKCLIRMAMARGEDVLFMETATRVNGGKAHAALEAVFVDPQVPPRAAPLLLSPSLLRPAPRFGLPQLNTTLSTQLEHNYDNIL